MPSSANPLAASASPTVATSGRWIPTDSNLRGHARSPAPEGAAAYRAEALLGDLAELVAAAGVESEEPLAA